MYIICMPTVLTVNNILRYMIHTKDHGHPHVTVYYGTPEKYEAIAKVRLDLIEVIESKGFNKRALVNILETTALYQQIWLEVWNETREG